PGPPAQLRALTDPHPPMPEPGEHPLAGLARVKRKYTYGDEKFETQPDWPDAHLDPTRRYLRAGGALSADAPAAAEAPESFPQHPLAGVCTQSTSQWTAGATEQIPCTTDDRLNEPTGATYTTAPLAQDLRLTGPVLASLW